MEVLIVVVSILILLMIIYRPRELSSEEADDFKRANAAKIRGIEKDYFKLLCKQQLSEVAVKQQFEQNCSEIAKLQAQSEVYVIAKAEKIKSRKCYHAEEDWIYAVWAIMLWAKKHPKQNNRLHQLQGENRALDTIGRRLGFRLLPSRYAYYF